MKKIKKLVVLFLLVFAIGMLSGGAASAFTVYPHPVKNGLVKMDGKYYYYQNGKKVTRCWKKLNNNRRYYFGWNGVAYRGSREVDGKRYIFNQWAQVAEPKGNLAVVTVDGVKYIADKSGAPRKGFQIFASNLWYADAKGKVLVSDTVDGIKFGKDGKAIAGTNRSLKIRCMQIVSQITNSSMSQSTKLRACWNYVVGGHIHYAGIYPNLGQAGWQRSLALTALTQGAGNCYGFACAFAALAKEVGYSPYVIYGRCPGSRDGAADGYTRHSWTRINGLNYDPEAQYAGWAPGIYGTSYAAGYVIGSVLF